MLKDLRSERGTSHYSGREYDQLCSTIARREEERKTVRQKLLAKLAEIMKDEDEEVVHNVFSAVNEML